MSISLAFINGNSVPEKRSGHVAVFHKGLLIVFGGYGDNRDDASDEFLYFKSIWCYSVEASQWTRHNSKGTLPEKNTGACAAVIGKELFLFGGYLQSRGHSNQLSSLDLTTFTWKDLNDKTSGVTPSSRDKFGCWIDGQNIIYFGGFGHPPENWSKVKGDFCFEEFPLAWSHGTGWNNHLHILDTSVLKWSQPKGSGSVPSPRAAFSISQIGRKCFLFGGRFKEHRRNDLYVLDSKSFHWTQLEPIGDSPSGRSWHVMENVSNNHLFIYGGFDNEGNALKDTWIYNISQNTWSELKTASKNLDIFAPRMWHTACKTDSPGEVLIFGGCINSIVDVVDRAKHTNTVSVFRFSPLSLRRQCLDFIMSNIVKYSGNVMELPQSLRRDIRHRSLALGLRSPNGHGKLISNCQMM